MNKTKLVSFLNSRLKWFFRLNSFRFFNFSFLIYPLTYTFTWIHSRSIWNAQSNYFGNAAQRLFRAKPRRCGRVVSASACQAGGLWFKSGIIPLLKHTCGESDWLLCWPYTPAEVAEVSHQRWISGNVYHICLCKVRIRQNPLWALKPRGDITRSPKQGYQWPQKWTCVQKFIKKKKIVPRNKCTRWSMGNLCTQE